MSKSNIGSDMISTVVAPKPTPLQSRSDQEPYRLWVEAGLRVSNPFEATGGRAPQSLPSIKLAAPSESKQVKAALTPADTVALAESCEGVADVDVQEVFLGSVWVSLVYVRPDNCDLQAAVFSAVRRSLSAARVAAQSIFVLGPKYVPLLIVIDIVLEPDVGREGVHWDLIDAFVPASTQGVQTVFFDPARWQMGDPVWGSAIETWASGVPGVRKATLRRLHRVGEAHPRQVPEFIQLLPGELPQVSDQELRWGEGEIRFEFAADGGSP